MTAFDPREVRASEVARGCERMSVLRALGTEQAEHDDEQKEWFRRGFLFELYVGQQLIAKHGAENVIAQPSFRHPLGVGHSDFLIVPERLLVEVKSTTSGTLSTPTFENGVEQLRIAIHYHPDADQGALYMINPSTLRPVEIFTVRNDEGDDARIDETFARIAANIAVERLPERVCRKPSQARGYFCPFAEPCFEGWVPEPAYELDDPHVLDLAARLSRIAAEERLHKDIIDGLEPAKRELKAELSEYLPDKGTTIVGPFEIRTWPVAGRVTVSAKALEAAGIDPYPFSTVGIGRTEVRVSQAEEPGAVEYGDEAVF